MTSASTGRPGTVAEETERLLRALGVEPSASGASRASTGPGRPGQGGPAEETTRPPQEAPPQPEQASPHTAQTCGWCPLCRLMALVREADDESVDRFVQGATQAVAAAVEIASQLSRPRGASADEPTS